MAAAAVLLLLLAPTPAAAVPARSVDSWRFSTSDVMPQHHRSLLQTSNCDVSTTGQIGDGCNSGAGLINSGADGVLGTFYWKQVRHASSERTACMQALHGWQVIVNSMRMLAERVS